MSRILLFSLILLPMYLFGQTGFEKRYGKGILEVNTSIDSSTFQFFLNPGDITPIIQVEFRGYTDTAKHCRDYSFAKTIGYDSIFVPELLHRSESCVPFQFTLAWVQEKNGFYQVIMNTSIKRKLVWIKKNSLLREVSFADYFKSMCSIETMDVPLIIKSEPSLKSRIAFDPAAAEIPEKDYKVKCLGLKGNWMQVRVDFTDLSKKSVTGWLIWRNETDSFILYNLMCC